MLLCLGRMEKKLGDSRIDYKKRWTNEKNKNGGEPFFSMCLAENRWDDGFHREIFLYDFWKKSVVLQTIIKEKVVFVRYFQDELVLP